MSDERVFEVSHIVDEDCSNPNQRVFKVRWVGYPSEYDSWEPRENLADGARRVIREWDHKQKQLAKRKAKEADVVSNQSKRERSASQTAGLRQRSMDSFIQNSHMVQAGNSLVKTKSENSKKEDVVVQRQTPEYVIKSEDADADVEVISEPSPTLVRRFKKPQSNSLYSEFLSALDNISGPPVWVVNDVDSEPCPPLVFKWIDDYHLGAGVPSRDEQFSIGCSCPGDECDLRDPASCECLDDAYEKRFSYDIDGLVHHPPGLPIIECTSRCGCGRTCPNRVVQRGRRMPLEIFKTQKKGWGIRTCRPIPKGMFICRYLGEVITEAEAERRGEEYDRQGITYLFDLDFFRPEPDGSDDGDSPGNLFCVDAMHYGDVSRFFNHSCNPNVAIYAVIQNGDNRVYDLAMFALRAIKPYEELCFDYKSKKEVTVKAKCFCGEKNCSGWLFGN